MDESKRRYLARRIAKHIEEISRLAPRIQTASPPAGLNVSDALTQLRLTKDHLESGRRE